MSEWSVARRRYFPEPGRYLIERSIIFTIRRVNGIRLRSIGSIPSMSNTRLWFLLSLAATAGILAVTLLLPLGFDNDVYEAMGRTLYAYHGLPYLASWDMNFPGIIFIHWASIALFGASDFGFRLFDYLTHIAMAGMYFAVLREWLNPFQRFTAVTLYALYYASGQWGLAGQRDEYAVLFLLIAVLVYFQWYARPGSKRSYGPAVIIGVLCALAFLVRPTYLLFLLSFSIVFARNPFLPLKKSFLSALVVGFVVPTSILVLAYGVERNGIVQLYNSVIRFNLEAYSGISVPVHLFTIGRAPIYIAAAIGLFFIARKKRSKGMPSSTQHAALKRELLICFAVSALLSPIVMGKYFTYHFAPFMMIAIGFAAVGVNRMAEWISLPALRPLSVVSLLIVFAACYYPRQLIRIFLSELGNEHPVERTYERVLDNSLTGIRAQNDVVAYIDRTLESDRPIEVASFFPSLRWRSGRPMATRFTSLVPLVPAVRSVPGYVSEWQREFI